MRVEAVNAVLRILGWLAGAAVIAILSVFLYSMYILSAVADEGSFWNDRRIVSCCSEADAVFADEWGVRDGKIYATVTGGGPRGLSWAPVGRTFEIPPEKQIDIGGNPTGRGLLFLRPSDLAVYCFIPGAGI